MTDDDEAAEAFKRAFQARLVATRKSMGGRDGLTQGEMAAKLGIPESRYAKYETRSHFPLYLLPRLIAETEKGYSYWCLGIEPRPVEPRSRAGRHLRVIE